MTNTAYQQPVLTDLGSVEDLTQFTIAFKLSTAGTDIHLSKNGIKRETGGKAGVSIDIS